MAFWCGVNTRLLFIFMAYRTHLIKEILKEIGKEVVIAGWVNTVRKHGKITFIDIRDRSGTVQVFCDKNITNCADIKPEYVISITGMVQKRPDGTDNKLLNTGTIEIFVKQCTILSTAIDLPVDITLPDIKASLETILDYRPLTLRHPKIKAIFELQNKIVNSFRSFFTENGFTEFQAPKIVPGDAEGGASVMKINYLDKIASLAQSPQLYKQILVGVFERVFTISTVFRGEPHSTTRHLNEYTSLDFEFGFIKDHTDIMKMENAWLKSLISALKTECLHIFNTYKIEIPEVLDSIPALHFLEAQKLIEKQYGEKCVGEPDLSPQHERWLCAYAHNKFNSEFIFITHYPEVKRPFYIMPDPDDKRYTLSFDLLFRGVEISTGGRRVENYEYLKQRIKDKRLTEKDFEFYLQAFKYGLPPHGGLGMGLERLTAKLLGLENVREATLFPRDINRIDLLFSQMND